MTKFTTVGLLQTKKQVLVQVNQGALAVATAARLLGMTRQGLWKLRQSFARHGNQALVGRKRGPKSWFRVHNRTPEWVEDKVAQVWQEHQVGPDRLLWILEDYHQDAFIHVSRATVYRILVRRRLLRPKTKQEKHQPQRQPEFDFQVQHLSCFSNFSLGVLYPRHFLGLLLISSTISSSSS